MGCVLVLQVDVSTGRLWECIDVGFNNTVHLATLFDFFGQWAVKSSCLESMAEN